MLTLRLALRNILGAGLRTWLNVVALSFSFVAIIFLRGFYSGMNDQAEHATVDGIYGGGQFWQDAYDPYDPLTLPEAHAVIPPSLKTLVDTKQATPILIRQGVIYPEGRFRAILVKGIDPGQQMLSIPAHLLEHSSSAIPALIGGRMSQSVGAHEGDVITVQWRDAHGTFDARDVQIVAVMRTTVQEIDAGQIWLPLDRLQNLTALPGHASMVVLRKDSPPPSEVSGWRFRSLDYLLQDVHTAVRSKQISGSILYAVLLFLALLAIFDTQVLSIFRRRKEMGTLMALGMTRANIIGLFTCEGALVSVFAALVAAAYGIPLLGYVAAIGWELPKAADNFGYALGERLFPVYSAGLVAVTTLLIMLATAFVSFLPTRRIAHLKPTDALRGRMS
jgi:putative ABC transport system permease protein